MQWARVSKPFFCDFQNKLSANNIQHCATLISCQNKVNQLLLPWLSFKQKTTMRLERLLYVVLKKATFSTLAFSKVSVVCMSAGSPM